jgi:PAS domain S-box-containing protein
MAARNSPALILAPAGRDAEVAAGILRETGIAAVICRDLSELVGGLDDGAGFGLITEEVLRNADLHALRDWLDRQPEWSDFPFILLTSRGGGLERNPAAGRYIDMLGNVTFLERPFHPTTLVSLVRAALRGRGRQYEARARLTELHESATRYRQIVEGAEDFAIIGLDGSGIIRSWNTGAQRVTGWSAVEAIGRGGELFFTPEDRDAGIPDHEMNRAASNGRSVNERWHLKKDGNRFWGSGLTMRLDQEGGGYLKIFRDRTSEHQAEAALRESEAQLREFNDTLELRVAQRSVELADAQEALRQSQKMEAMGTLTGGVAHDFNNLLTPIVGSLDLLQRRGIGTEREQRLIAGALQSAERAKTLVQRLLAFARKQPLQARSVDLAELIRGMGDLVSRSSGPRVDVVVDLAPDLPPVLTDPNQLEMAILNLAVNARDAMPDSGTLTLCARPVEVGVGHSELRPGSYVHLTVADTGVGMDEETLARAIEPFFSTKGIGRGTGLGLSMVHGLSAQLGGTLAIRSQQGQGTQVELWLPTTDETAAIDSMRQPMLKPRTAGTVLLVDDENLVRQSTADMLSDLGFDVVETSSADSGLQLVREGLVPDLLVTDHLMPGMTGVELARAVLKIRPDTAVLVISGYAELEGIAPDLPRLPKPFRQSELAQSVAGLQRRCSTSSLAS